MTGKIYKDSANLYEDQARVLFDYYRKAAEQIVGEETRVEQQISNAKAQLADNQKAIDSLTPRKIAAFAGGALLLLLYFAIGWFAFVLAAAAVGFGLYTHLEGNTLLKKKAAIEAEISALQTAHQQIRRDYRVHKLGVAYVPVAKQIPFEGKSFLIDLTESTARQEFKLSSVRRSELFTSTISELEDLLKEAPLVEDSSNMEEIHTDQLSRSIQKISHYDYVGSVDRKLRAAAFCLTDLDTTAVQLPTIAPDSEMAAYLAAHSTDDTGGLPVIRPFAVDRFDAELETFRSLNEMKKSLERHSEQFEEVLRRLMMNMARSVQSMTQSKMESTSLLVEHSNRLLFTILKASYNHYSPRLEAEEIERIRNESFDYQESVESYRPFQLKSSSRVLYDPISDNWGAEDGSRAKMPFGLNQIQEEIISPMVQNLMSETRLERLRIYNNIKDQKIDYLNQWHRDTEDFYGRNRLESNDLIGQMRSTFSDFIASFNALNALEKTEKTMSASGSLDDAVTKASTNSSEVVASYDLKSKEFQAVQDEFGAYMERLKDDIDERAKKYGFMEYYDASLRDGNARDFAVAAGQAHTLDDRRKPLLAVSPHFAAESELPPPPSVEEEVYQGLAMNLETVAREALNELDAPTVAVKAKAAGAGR